MTCLLMVTAKNRVMHDTINTAIIMWIDIIFQFIFCVFIAIKHTLTEN